MLARYYYFTVRVLHRLLLDHCTKSEIETNNHTPALAHVLHEQDYRSLIGYGQVLRIIRILTSGHFHSTLLASVVALIFLILGVVKGLEIVLGS